MLIYVKIRKKNKKEFFFKLCEVYANFMLIYVKNIKKKKKKKKKKKTFYGQTDGRTTQNYSSEPHKI